jgi:hypothetical protein
LNFELDADQDAILGAVGTLLSRHAGVERLRELGGDRPAYDGDLDGHLDSAGFADIAEPGAGNRLEAALVQEAIAMSLGSVASAYRLLVLPSIPTPIDGPVAVIPAGHSGPVRFAADASTIIVIGDHDVRLVDAVETTSKQTYTRLGWPAGTITDLPYGNVVADVRPSEVRAWVNVALAVELVGAMRFALDLSVGYVIDREQFGRAIGSFQAVQHGLAECAVALEGARWMTLEAAWSGDMTAASLAITHALDATELVFHRTHQYCGAIGFTQEYDLHLATMRLPALRAEALAHERPAAASVSQIWGVV